MANYSIAIRIVAFIVFAVIGMGKAHPSDWTVDSFYSYNNPWDDDKSTPIGWGYMAPAIVVRNGFQYAPQFYRCGEDEHFYCVRIIRNSNGTSVVASDVFEMGKTFVPTSMSIDYAYQPPLIFLKDKTLYMAYWLMDTDETTFRSYVHLVKLKTNAALPISWQHVSFFENTLFHNLNYLGGAMGPSDELVFAGYGTRKDGSRHTLELVKVLPPYGDADWQTKREIRGSSDPAFKPLYPQVDIRNNGYAKVATVLENGAITPCPENKTLWKQTEAYWVPDSQQTPFLHWRVQSSDTAADPAINGNRCLKKNQRFPVDQMYDSPNDDFYTIIRSQEYLTPSQSEFETKYILYKSSIVKNPDIGAAFLPYFDSDEIDSISMTKLSNGYFVYVASGHDGDIAIIRSLNGHSNFSTPYYLPNFLPAYTGTDEIGEAVKLLKPSKNGVPSVDKLHFVHSSPACANPNSIVPPPCDEPKKHFYYQLSPNF